MWAPCSNPEHAGPAAACTFGDATFKWESTLHELTQGQTDRDPRPAGALASTWHVPHSKSGNWQTPEKNLSVALFIIIPPCERHFRSILGILAKLSLLTWCSTLLAIPGSVLNPKQNFSELGSWHPKFLGAAKSECKKDHCHTTLLKEEQWPCAMITFRT